MPLVGEVPPPPPSTRTRKTSAAKTTTPITSPNTPPEPSKLATRTTTLMEFAGIAQGVALMTGNFADAETIENHAGNLLTAVAKLGDVHENFGAWLDKTEGMGPYFALFAAAVPMALQFMANHNRIDASRVRFGGLQDPAVLENRQRSKVAYAQAEMIRQQREAQEQAHMAQQKLREEVEAFNSLAEQMNNASV